MNRNRLLAFVAAVVVLAGLGVVVWQITKDEPAARQKTGDAGPAAPAAADSRQAPVPPAPVSRKGPGPGPRPPAPSPAEATGMIQGIVVTEAGVPVEGASCELFEDVSMSKDRFQEGESIEKQVSSSEGLFLFDRQTVSPFAGAVLKVMHPMYVTERKPIDPRKLEPVITVRMRAGSSISGTVRAVDGAVLPGASIQVFDMTSQTADPAGSVDGVATADATGAYTVVSVTPGLKRVRASMPGYATREQQAVKVDPEKAVKNLDFALDEAALLTGQVLSVGNAPVASAFVTASPIWTASKPGRAAPAKDGEAARDLTPGEPLPKKDPGAPKSEAGPPRRAPQGPIEPSITVRSREDGTFEVPGVAPGTYVVSVVAQGYTNPAQQTVETPKQNVTFVCAEKARILGRVIDADTGKPVGRFTIGLATTPDDVPVMGGSRMSYGPPKFKDGAFEVLDVAPGRFWVVAFAQGYAGGRSDEVLVAPGERKQGVEIRLVRGATITGRVVDSAGKPIAGANVVAEPSSMREGFIGLLGRSLRRTLPEGKTRGDGTYAIANVLAGSYVVAASHPDFGPGASAAFAVPVSGESPQPDLVLGRGATIKGRVKLADGQPDAKASVQVTAVGSALSFGENKSAFTDSDGRFEVGGLAAGQYRVTVVQRAGQTNAADLFLGLNKANIIAVAEGEVREIDL